MLFNQDQFTKVAVSGLGGVGKTQLVLELLHRLRAKNKKLSAIWVQATTMESLDQGYHIIAQKLGLQASGGDSKKLVQDFLSEESAGRWVLVFDNADDINMWIDKPQSPGSPESSARLLDYIPKSRYGRVIFTTRDAKAAIKLAEKNVLELHQMAEDAAQRMLRNLLINEKLVDSSPDDAKAMLTWLTHLPLAIAQAAAFINENRITLADYLELVNCQEDEVIDLLTEEFEDDARYSNIKNPVATTWLISFQQIQQRDPLAADYMAFMACLDHKDIPQVLLPPGPSRKAEMMAIGTLTAYSFLTFRPEDAAYDLHRLVHLAIRNWLRKEGVLAEWTLKAAARLEAAFPDHQHENRALWRMLLPHARRVLDTELLPKDNASRIGLEWHVAVCYFTDGRWDEAETLFRGVMEYRALELGLDHPDTLRSMSKLAWTYHSRSRFPEAKSLGEKALDAQKRILGEDDPETLSTMSNLAMTCSDLSQWPESETLELRALELRTRVLGAEHPDTLIGMSNLVYLYNCQGLWEKAASLGAVTTSIRKKVLGPDHPNTLLSIGNLAHTYNNQARYAEAETLLSQVVAARTRLLGRHHPHTLSGMSNLAVSYHHQGRYPEAEALQGEVARVRAEKLGETHFSTLTSLAHLVVTYHKQGRLAEAEELGRQVAERRGRVLGGEHHHTLASLGALAAICRDLGELGRAEELGVQVLAVRVGALGLRHPQVMKSMGELAETYRRMGRVREAEDLEAQVAEAGEEERG